MAVLNKGLFVISAKRTPFCKYGGAMRELPASHAFAAAAKATLESANMNTNHVDCTIVGNVNFLSQCDGGKTSRYCGIYSGIPIEKPALGVNKTCASGLQALITSGVEILSGSANACLTGGTEIISSLPMLARNVRFGTTLNSPYILEDYIKTEFPDSYTGLSLQKMAEDLARNRNITRNEIDKFAANSHLKWKSGDEQGIFDAEIAKVDVTFKKREITIFKDDLPDPSITTESLSYLPTILEDGSLLTASNIAVPARGPFLTTGHKVAQANFARFHQNWDDDALGQVLFSDESRFCLKMMEEVKYGGDLVKIKYAQSNIVGRELYGRGSIMTPADGAAALLLANEETIKQNNLNPLARITGWSCVGVDPIEPGIGTSAALKELLKATSCRIEDIDCFEINEIFPSEVLIAIKQLNIEEHKVNKFGGAIALGNPVAATGARMATHLAHQISSQKYRKAVAVSSCGGGQGIAVMFECV